jgi:hypothetical protein
VTIAVAAGSDAPSNAHCAVTAAFDVNDVLAGVGEGSRPIVRLSNLNNVPVYPTLIMELNVASPPSCTGLKDEVYSVLPPNCIARTPAR